MSKNNAELQETIVAQWKAFSNTEAYKDWERSMGQYMDMIQNNVDNMVEPRPVAAGKVEQIPMTLEKSGLMNQRKVGVKYCMEYAQLRVKG